ERREAPVVHVRGGEGEIAQRRYPQRPLTRAVAREARPPGRALRVAVVAGEVDPRVARGAAGARREEERHAGLGLRRERRVLAGEHVAVEGRGARKERALEGGDRLHGVPEADRRGLPGEGRGEGARALGIGGERGGERALAAAEAELHRVL